MSLENKQVKFSKVMGRVLVLVSSRYEFESAFPFSSYVTFNFASFSGFRFLR